MTPPAPTGLPPARMLRVGRAFVAHNATVCGRVTLREDANVWYGVVIRGDDAPIRVGVRTNIQDNSVIHVDPEIENVIGDDVTIGHGAICHGARIHDYALIGMGARLLAGSVIGEGAVVGAGAVVRENQEVAPYSLVVGMPARVVRTLDPAGRRRDALEIARGYVAKAEDHAGSRWDGAVDVTR